jgi:hypothetical protein
MAEIEKRRLRGHQDWRGRRVRVEVAKVHGSLASTAAVWNLLHVCVSNSLPTQRRVLGCARHRPCFYERRTLKHSSTWMKADGLPMVNVKG